MTNLLDNIGNGFQKRNLLHDQHVVTVYVENEDDVPFWKHIFDQFNFNISVFMRQCIQQSVFSQKKLF